MKRFLGNVLLILSATLTMGIISFAAIEASNNRKEKEKQEIVEIIKTQQLEHKCSKSDSLELLKTQINVLTQKLYNCEYK